MKRKNSLKRASVIQKTVRDYSKREKMVTAIALVVFLFSGWKAITGNWSDLDIVDVVQGVYNYNEGLVGEIIRLNPVYADLNEVDRDITSLVFEGLAKYDPAQKKVVENIASHTLDSTKTIYTFTLNEGLTWHDGTPVTAKDVYFTYHDVIQHPEFENPILKESFSGVTVEQTDDRTITMTVNETNAFFFSQLTVGILPEHILGDVPVSELDTHEFNQNPVGNGPYKVDGPYQVEGNQTSVKLVYHEGYWNGDSPAITEVNFTTYETYEELLEARNHLHGIARVPKYRIDETTQERFKENEYSLPQYTALFMETDQEELVKRGIRLGVQKAIDRESILESIGYDRMIDTPLLELNQEDWLNQNNPEEAAGSFFDEGWKLDEERGVRVNEDEDEILSFRLVRRSYPDNEKQEEVTRITAEMIAEQLGEVGVEVTIESYEGQLFQEKVSERDYDLLLYGQSLGYNQDTYSFWHSSQSYTGLNLSNYGNARADFNIEALRNTFNDEAEKRQEYLQNLGEIINNDIPAVFLYTPTYYFLTDERIQNIETNNLLFPHDRFANILDWTVES